MLTKEQKLRGLIRLALRWAETPRDLRARRDGGVLDEAIEQTCRVKLRACLRDALALASDSKGEK
jgi:hypothetical protein